MRSQLAVLLMVILICVVAAAQTIPVAEYAQRRQALFDQLPDGLLLINAKTGPKEMDQTGWHQNATFYYFTGLANQPEAILLLDGPAREARLFVAKAPALFGIPVKSLIMETGPVAAEKLLLTDILSREQFAAFITSRLKSGIQRIYVDEPRHGEATGVPYTAQEIEAAMRN